MWENIVEFGKPQMTTWRMSIAFWVPKATHTHTHTHTLGIYTTYCVPLQQLLQVGTSLLGNTSCFFLCRYGPTRAMASSFLRFLDHTQIRHTR